MRDTVQFYIKRPIKISAIQFNGANHEAIREFVGKKLTAHNRNKNMLFISTLEGMLEISRNDYVIRGIAGEFYPCKEHIFNETYDEVQND